MSRPGSGLARLLVGLAALLLLIMIAAVISSMEKVERTVRIPPAPEARRNPLLAAERFLGAMGVQAESKERLDALPPTDHMLLLGMQERLLTQTQAEELLDWVAGGGYLVVGPQLRDGISTQATENDRLLEMLGVRVEPVDDVGDNDRETMEIALEDDEESLEVEFYSAIALTMDQDEEELGYAFVWDDHGEGRYVVLNDMEHLRSEQIGKFDHAAFLWRVVQFGDTREHVQLIHGMQQASIWSMLGRFAWPLILAAALLLGALAWRRAARFGPTLPLPASGSRSLIDHVDGLGWFLWRRKRADALVDAAREALLQRAALRRPDFARGDRQAQISMLTAGSELAAAKVEAAMFGSRTMRQDEYTKTIRTLERLRRKL